MTVEGLVPHASSSANLTLITVDGKEAPPLPSIDAPDRLDALFAGRPLKRRWSERIQNMALKFSTLT